MPKVDMVATRDFTYMTRRLAAGDPFQARNPLEAKILHRVRGVAEVPAPKAAKVIPTVEQVLEAEVVEEPVEETVDEAPPKPKAKAKRKAKK